MQQYNIQSAVQYSVAQYSIIYYIVSYYGYNTLRMLRSDMLRKLPQNRLRDTNDKESTRFEQHTLESLHSCTRVRFSTSYFQDTAVLISVKIITLNRVTIKNHIPYIDFSFHIFVIRCSQFMYTGVNLKSNKSIRLYCKTF